MTDNAAVTDSLRQLADEPDDDLGGHTIVIDEADIMATREMRALLDPASDFINSLEDDNEDRE